MAAPVLAVLNMKGGVGKTTLAAHVSNEIFLGKGLGVLLIDLDPQYNLSQQLIAPATYKSLSTADRTSLRLFEPLPATDFFDVNVTNDQPPSPKSIAYNLYYLISSPETKISLIAGTFQLTKYSFIWDQHKLEHARRFFKRAIAKARDEYDLIILDMNPSSSFLTLCGLAVATDILSPVRPDKYSLLGLDLVRQLIEHPSVGNKPDLHIVMNGVRRNGPLTDIEKDIRTAGHFKGKILSNRIYNSGVLAARSDYTGFASDRKVSNRRVVASELRNVGLELCKRMGI